MTERRHRDLPVWKASMDLIEAFYLVSAKLPKEEMFGLQSQMRRAAVSVASNIAAGAARKSTAERLGYFDDTDALQAQLDGVQGQLLAVIQSLQRRSR